MSLAIFLKKMKIFGNFFEKKKASFGHFFDSQIAVFRKVRMEEWILLNSVALLTQFSII